MTTMQRTYFYLAATLMITACKKDPPPNPATPPPSVNEEEVITTLRVIFSDTVTIGGTNETYTLEFSDIDGDGGQAPVITGDTLPVDRFFNVALTIWNEASTTPIDLTEEIIAEAEEHQFFFDHPELDIMLTDFDLDGNGSPIGTTFNAQTVSTGQGTFKVTLRHQPDKDAPGVAQGDITNAGGDTDIEVFLPLVIE